MDLKYVPVLRYRSAELDALLTVTLSEKTLPLIELIQCNPTGRKLTTPKPFEQIFSEKLSTFDHPFMIDIPMYINLSLSNIKSNIRDFLNPIYVDQALRIYQYQLLSGIPDLIPVISYRPTVPYISNFITQQESSLRPYFPHLAFRVFCNSEIYNILAEISTVIKKDDILIIDLENNHYSDTSIQPIYTRIENLRTKIDFRSVILHTPIPNSITNTSITNCTKVPGTNNSLLSVFSSSLHFDAIGDYAGIKKDDLVDGFMGYIASIYYEYARNEYIGFTANPSKNPNTYASVIAPTIVGSSSWSSYTAQHHSNCHGCIHIDNINRGITNCGSRTTWKTICIQHYIYTIEESL